MDEERLVSLVLLTAEEPRLQPFQAQKVVPFATPAPDTVVRSDGWTQMYWLEGRERGLVVNVFRSRYAEPSEGESRTRRTELVVQHRGWMSVDIVGGPPGGDAEDWRRIGRVVLALAAAEPSRVLLILHPDSGRLAEFSGEMFDVLASEDPLQVFALPVQIEPDDPELLAAVEEAGRRWPEFEAALASRRPGQAFSIKTGFAADGGLEHMWVDVESLAGSTVVGTLSNRPLHATGVRQGDPVRIPRDRVEDWAVYSEGRLVAGGFTARLIEDR